MLTDTTRKLFALQQIKGIGPSTLESLVALPDFLTSSIEDLALANKKIAKALNSEKDVWPNALNAAEAEFEALKKNDARLLCVLDEEYPALLKETHDKPFFLYIKGELSKQPLRSVSVIGTREPTTHGAIITERITEFLVSDKWSIVSGLALGCDAIAHNTAILNGGHTVAVMAHGLHTVAPKQHVKLANQILEKGGALISEYGFGVEPLPYQFVKRDRIQAGLSRGVVMIQSDLVGGSLHASRAAIEYKRILAIPVATSLDIQNRQNKIQANQLLTGNEFSKKADLLKCNPADLNLIFNITTRNDYVELSNRLTLPTTVV